MEWDSAYDAFIEELEKLEASGYSCSDHASAWHQLCVRQAGAETVEVDGLEVEVPVLEKPFLALEPLEPTD